MSFTKTLLLVVPLLITTACNTTKEVAINDNNAPEIIISEEDGLADSEENTINLAPIQLEPVEYNEVVITGLGKSPKRKANRRQALKMEQKVLGNTIDSYAEFEAPERDVYDLPHDDFNTEAYDHIAENEFKAVNQHPLSTFSIDVDKASYANVRRFLNQGQLPPKDAVRIEELINYFTYEYPQPDRGHPFSITTERTTCPWNAEHELIHVGLQGAELSIEEAPINNLVFLIDVSGSMSSHNKLGLLKKAFSMLVENLREEDRVSIVVYAGAAGLVLPSTSGRQKTRILSAIDRLNAGGSTAGGAGIKLAYKVAQENFLENGNNRVIIATDGDFNIGESSDAAMVRLIEEKREAGVYLTVLGFGMGNYKDSKMEKLADKGNGNYAYIDNLREAQKVLVDEMSGTLFTIAKDVKLQLEFNPAHVKAYRLIGYENRKLNKEDFNDDTKDAGELGAGHRVTALYEIIPSHSSEQVASVDPLRYQHNHVDPDAEELLEVMTVKFRYKPPKEDKSRLIVHTMAGDAVPIRKASNTIQFASAVAEFGMLLRDSQFKGEADFSKMIARANYSKGYDLEGYRAEFIKLAKRARSLSNAQAARLEAQGE